MNMKADVNTVRNCSEATETVGDATIKSWALFASLEELRRAPAVPEAGEAAMQHAPANAAPAAAQDKDSNLQSVLGQYTAWLSAFNR